MKDYQDGKMPKRFLSLQTTRLQVKICMMNKYRNKKQFYKGIKFDSKKELQRYLILEEMQMKKLIYDLEIHPVFPLLVNGIKIGRYTADFKYKNQDGEVVIEDVKSKITKTRDYMLRKKILATYNPPIIIQEIL